MSVAGSFFETAKMDGQRDSRCHRNGKQDYAQSRRMPMAAATTHWRRRLFLAARTPRARFFDLVHGGFIEFQGAGIHAEQKGSIGSNFAYWRMNPDRA